MEIKDRLISFTISISIFVAIGFFMKKRRILPEQETSMVLAKLIMNLALPAMIFGTLAASKIKLADFKLPGVVLIIEIVSMVLAYIAGRMFRLSRARMGSLMLVSTFSNMSALGISLIDDVYTHNVTAISYAVLCSEIGNQLLLQTLGIMVAYIFGSRKEELSAGKIAREFVFNPPTIAIILGLTWTFYSLPVEGVVLSPVFLAIKKADMMLAGLVGLLIGFSIRKVNIRLFLQTALTVIILEHVLEPFATYGMARLSGFTKFETDILIILMSMPSAALNVAIAKKYGCDSELAANLTLVSMFFSLVSIYMVSFIL